MNTFNSIILRVFFSALILFPVFQLGPVYPLGYAAPAPSDAATPGTPDKRDPHLCRSLLTSSAGVFTDPHTIGVPWPLRNAFRKLSKLPLEQLIDEIESLGEDVVFSPGASGYWARRIPNYIERTTEWPKGVISRSTYGEYDRENHKILINLRAKAFGKANPHRHELLRWVLIHEFGHAWFQKKTTSQEPKRTAPSPIVYVVDENHIEQLSTRFESLGSPEAARAGFEIVFSSLQRTVVEEILIEVALNHEFLISNAGDGSGLNQPNSVQTVRLAYLSSAVRGFQYSLGNLLEVAHRLENKGIFSHEQANEWTAAFKDQLNQVLELVMPVLMIPEKKDVTLLEESASVSFSDSWTEFLHEEARFSRDYRNLESFTRNGRAKDWYDWCLARFRQLSKH